MWPTENETMHKPGVWRLANRLSKQTEVLISKTETKEWTRTLGSIYGEQDAL